MNVLTAPSVSQKCSHTHVQLSALTSGSTAAPACLTCAADDANFEMTMSRSPEFMKPASTAGVRALALSQLNISVSGMSASA